MAKEITQLQHDIVRQDIVNKDLYSRTLQTEETIADLLSRITDIEDKATTEETNSQRTTRSKAPMDPLMEKKLQEMAKEQSAL
jgi:hypothetical protein